MVYNLVRYLAVVLMILVLADACWCRGRGDAEYDHGHGVTCGLVKRLRLNESFTFSNFPTARTARHQSYGLPEYYRQRPFFPAECTWIFEAKRVDGDDCQLEFHFQADRHEVDCEEQYFLIGDENQEKRFCGFKKPPRNFTSTGRQLFLTHYQRNRHRVGPTITTRLGGIVSCVQKPPPGPPPIIGTCRPTLPVHNISAGFVAMAISLGADSPFALVNCTPENNGKCLGGGQVCFYLLPIDTPIQLPPPPLPAAIVGTNCSDSVQLRGSCTPTCGVIFFWATTDVPGFDHDFQECTGDPLTQKCVFYGNVCVSPEP